MSHAVGAVRVAGVRELRLTVLTHAHGSGCKRRRSARGGLQERGSGWYLGEMHGAGRDDWGTGAWGAGVGSGHHELRTAAVLART